MITTLRTALFAALCITATACVGEIPSQLVLGLGESCRASIDCADGLECETEHGQSTCQPHRGGGTSGGGTSDGGTASRSDSSTASSSDSGSRRDGSDDDAAASTRDASSTADATRGALGATCAVDADCAAPLECEVEHGVGACQPHGGHGGR